mgnify:FL=1
MEQGSRGRKRPKKAIETMPFSDIAFDIEPEVRREWSASKIPGEEELSDDPLDMYHLRRFSRAGDGFRLYFEERIIDRERHRIIGETGLVVCTLGEFPLRDTRMFFGPSERQIPLDESERQKDLERLRRTVAEPYSIEVDLANPGQLKIGAFLSEQMTDENRDLSAVRIVNGQIIVSEIDELQIPHGEIVPRGEFFEKMAGGVLFSKSPDDSTTPQSERLLPNGAYSRLTGYRQS